MKERLTNNLGLKILAVVIAVVMWLIMVNVSNPLVVDSQEVTVDMVNAEVLEKSNLTYEIIGKKTVTISYEVRIRDRYKISSSDFYVYADLAEMYDVTGSVPVKIEISNRNVKAMIEGTPVAKPGVVRVETEPLQKKRFYLGVNTIGQEEEGYVAGDVALNPEYVYVTGAESVIGQISSVGVELNVEGANSDMEGTAPVYFYDANGNKLNLSGEQAELNLTEVNYSMTVLKVKNLALNFQVDGRVADGYRFTGVECDRKSIDVEGLKSALASMSTLTIPGEYLNVSGATSDVKVEVDLAELLPDNITIAGDADSIVNVTLKVEQLKRKTLSYQTSNVVFEGEKDGYSYSFGQENVMLEIQGLEEDLDRLQEKDIAVSLDVSELEPGAYPAEFDIELNEGYELVKYDPIMIEVQSQSVPDNEETESSEEVSDEAQEAVQVSEDTKAED